ncbi:universal stress protein [Puia sp. P3]|uniref:universal stress protein n=1 Tax=Puia sp. P3 TaxID=3423952 RepID=UPI003D66A930
MRKIIVPVSFGVNSANAARYAAAIGPVTGSEIRLVYVLQSPSVFSHHPMPGFLFNEMRDSGFRLLDTLRNDLSGRSGGKVRVTTDMEIGDIDQRLKAYCSKHRPFLIVMGTSESAPERDFGAIHALEAMKRLSYPLLIIPPGASFHGAPKVVIACDREDIFTGLTPIIPFLKELHELLGTRFEIVHVLAEGEGLEETQLEYQGGKKNWKLFNPGYSWCAERTSTKE